MSKGFRSSRCVSDSTRVHSGELEQSLASLEHEDHGSWPADGSLKSLARVLPAFAAIALGLGLSSVPAYAQPTLTNITFISHGTVFLDGAYINDTIVDAMTSPLAFTATGGLSQPFLNASDSTIALGYGTYFAISFRAYGAMSGPGTVSFVLNGITYSQNVIFPDPAAASDVFASFSLPGGDSVTVAATGLSADRISIVPDGGGMVPDGVPDAFYLLRFAPHVVSACDVNLDTFVDIRDVQYLINQALGGMQGGNDLNLDGAVNVIDSQIEINWVLFGCPAVPSLILANPNLGVAGQMNESVNVIGQSTHWVQGSTTASFGGAGITVAKLTVNSPTSATVVLNIDPAAAVTSRSVVFTTGAEVVTLSSGFSIAGAPALILVNPNTGRQGLQGETVNLTGQYTNWVQGISQVTFGGGSGTVNNYVVNGTADLWLAGQPDGQALGGDSAPANGAVMAWSGQNTTAGRVLTITATGSTDYGGCNAGSPDGGCGLWSFGPSLSVSAFQGPADALIGVFVSAGSTNAPLPAPIDFSSVDAQSQLTIAPLLNQAFFIGDGLTGTGTGALQQFVIPLNATQLYLGSGDSAGANYNNQGLFNVVVTDSGTAAALTVNSPTSATATLTVDANAPVGPRDVTVTTGVEVVSMNSGFTVTPGPHLLSISPTSALAGQANLPVTITGQNTHFTNATVIDLGSGMTLSAVSATDATHLSANLTVAGSGNMVGNGSLEDLSGFFVNYSSNYMALYAGATTIAGWTVTPSTTNEIVWGQSPTSDSYSADGKYFVDLTGFGSDSPNGGLTQQLQGLISGQEYVFSMDTLVDTTQPAVTIGSATVGLSAGQAIQEYTSLWVPQTGTFVADSTSPILTIANQDQSQLHSYIDNIVITVPGAASLGVRNLTVSTGTEVESLLNGFAVNGAPVVLSVTPSTGSQSQANVPVTVTGQYTHFSNTSVVTFSGAGVTAGAPTASTATSVTVPVTVAGAAALGLRQIQVQTGAETALLAGAYMVIAPAPAVTQAAPNTGSQGQNESVSISGQFTHWVQGTTTASFGAGVALSTLTITSSTTATAVLNIDPAAVVGPRNIVFTTGAEAATLNNGFTVAAGTPVLTLISPNTGVQGQQNEIINITGSFTQWVQDATGATFGDGVTPVALNVNSPTSATLYVNIDPAAVLGARTVTLYTATDTATLIGGFTVVGATPSLTLVSPYTGQQGQQNLSVNLTGQFTHWAQGATTASFGAGVTVAALTINSATTATASLNIDAATSLGVRTVSMTTGPEAVTLVNGFTIVVPAPAITSALPGSGLKGQALQVALTGQNTHFQQGVTKANFGPGVSVGGSIAGSPGLVTVTSPTAATASVTISASSASGPRTILAQTGTESASLINGFAVKGPPYLSSITPNSAQPGDTLTVAIHGTYTSFQQGVTTATFGLGISVGGGATGAAGPVTVLDTGTATAQLVIDPAASPGLRNPIVQTGVEQASLTNSGFAVLGQVTGPAPVPTITSPAESDQVISRITVTGSVDSPNLSSWVLEYQATGTTAFTQFGSGTATTVSAVFDPSLLLNGIANIRLTATDASGQTGVATTNVVVAGRAKVGNFSVSFNDLTVPVAGIPIELIRSYDTRNKASGDFGFGWTLSVQSSKVQTNVSPGDSWQGVKQGFGAFASYCVADAGNHVVTLALQGGDTYTFQPTFTQPCGQFVGPQYVSMIFTPTGLTPPNATLQVPDGAGLMVFGSFPGDIYLADPDTYETYDPDQFILTLPSGVQMLISKSFGVQSLTDQNQRTLSFTPNGITSSTGVGVGFTRDSQNRIASITDPNGNTINYSYTDAGDLAEVQDAMAHVSTFVYDDAHDLVSYVDGTGHQATRNVYDDSGRLIQVIDAFGNVTNLTHDLGASTETVTDKLGNPTTIVYDASGNVLSETDPLGHVTTSAYDTSANILSVTDPLGHTTSYTYDSNNNRTTETDGLGHTTTRTFDASNHVLTVQDANGNTRTNSYDPNGNVTGVTDAAGNQTTYGYDGNGNQNSITNALGKATSYTYTRSGKVASSTDASGVLTQYNYDANGHRTSQTVTRTTPSGPQVQTSTYQYDTAGNLTLTTLPDGTTKQQTFNANGMLTSEVDEKGATTTYTYNEGGQITQITYPDGRSATMAYDANGQRTQMTTASGETTFMTYDAAGHLLTVIDPGTGATTVNAYDAAGNQVSVTDPLGHTTQFAFDAANRRTSITDVLHHVTTFAYDSAGNQTSITDANNNTVTRQFNSNNLMIKATYPDGTTEQIAYNAGGKPATKTDAAGEVTRFAYDASGRLLSVTDALGQTTLNAYDEPGNLISQTDANGHQTNFSYDSMGRRTGRTLPGGQSETLAYDSVGDLSSHTDFNGKVTTYAYDSLNRLISKTPDPSFHAPAVTYTYTANSLRSSMTDVSGTTSYAYDGRGRLTQVTNPNGTLSYTYDLVNNLTSITGGRGTSMSYTYDAANRLATMLDQSGGQTTYSYDAVNDVTGVTDPNGVTFTYAYNKRNQITSLGAAKGATPVAGYTYALDATGRRLSVSELGGRIATYGYDDTHRLTSETVAGATSGPNGAVSYMYDPAGNRRQTTSTLAGVTAGSYTYDVNDRLTTDTYDADGNTLSSDGLSNGYDFENHLIQHGSVTMVYDGDGNRVSKSVGGVTTKYLIDLQNPTGHPQVIEESLSDGSSRLLTYGLQRISQKQFLAGTNTTVTSYFVFDGLGSVRSLTDATGTITDTYDYDAYGNLIHTSGTTFNEFRFAGEQFDPDIGLYYNRARYLKTSTGRFMTLDAMDGDARMPITLNKYLYANADPANAVDPSGNQGDLGSLMTALSLNNSLETAVLGESLRIGAGLGSGFIVNLLLPPGYWDVIASQPISAFLAGGAFSASASGGLGAGLTTSIGLDFLLNSRQRLVAAAYDYVGAGLSLGKTALSGGVSGYIGAVWRTADSSHYEGYFETLSVSLGSIGQYLKNIQSNGLKAAAEFGSVLPSPTLAVVGQGPEYFLYVYHSDLYKLAGKAAQVLTGNVFISGLTASLFFDPTDPAKGSMGFSLGIGFSTPGSTSNMSITGSYFVQSAPAHVVPFP